MGWIKVFLPSVESKWFIAKDLVTLKHKPAKGSKVNFLVFSIKQSSVAQLAALVVTEKSHNDADMKEGCPHCRQQ